jgi:hypothetical protein
MARVVGLRPHTCIHGALTHGSRVTSAVLYFFFFSKKDMPRLKRGKEEVITVPIRLCIGNINLSLFYDEVNLFPCRVN